MNSSFEVVRSLFEQSSDLVQIVTLDGAFIYTNPAWHRVLEYDSFCAAATPACFWQVLHPDDRDRYQQICAQLQTDGDHCTLTLTLLTQNQATVSVTGEICCRMNPGESPQFWCLWRRIREPIEQALHQMEERYRLATRAARVGVWEWQVQTGEFYLDPNVKALLGYTDLEIPNDLNQWVNYVHPDDRQAVMAAAQAHLEGKTLEYVFEHRMLHKEGSIRWILVRGLAIRNAQGEVVRMVGTDTDITERKQAELRLQQLNLELETNVAQRTAQLQSNEERLRTLSDRLSLAIKSGAIGIWDWDIINNHLIWDERMCELYGIPSGAFDGSTETLLNLIHPDDRASAAAQGQRALTENTDYDTEFRVVHPDGSIRSIKAYGLVQRNGAGEPQRMIGINLDITERKQAEMQLREMNETLAIANAELACANRLKDEFLANMSHELRTPLNAILGLAEVLQSEAFGTLNEKQQQFVDTIFSSGNHLLDLISDILDLAKIEAGKFELELAPASLEAICEASLTLVNPQADQKNMRLEAHLPPESVEVYVDERRLRQALVNLLSNGIKFTPEGGSVMLQVAIDSTANQIHFHVVDTGIGIAAADRDRLFQPFVQIDSGLSRCYEGTGLGLALVKQITEMHGGTVCIESQPGQGSRFTLTLPWRKQTRAQSPDQSEESLARSPQNAPVQSPVQSLQSLVQSPATAQTFQDSSPNPSFSSPGSIAPPNPTLLLVDDNPSTQLLLQDYLEFHGFQVLVAANGLEALHLLNSHRPQLILMDIQMPAMNGLETIHHLRNNPVTASIPVIALTALAMLNDRDRCLAAGANDYLSKPIKLEELLDKARHFVREM